MPGRRLTGGLREHQGGPAEGECSERDEGYGPGREPGIEIPVCGALRANRPSGGEAIQRASLRQFNEVVRSDHFTNHSEFHTAARRLDVTGYGTFAGTYRRSR